MELVSQNSSKHIFCLISWSYLCECNDLEIKLILILLSPPETLLDPWGGPWTYFGNYWYLGEVILLVQSGTLAVKHNSY